MIFQGIDEEPLEGINPVNEPLEDQKAKRKSRTKSRSPAPKRSRKKSSSLSSLSSVDSVEGSPTPAKASEERKSKSPASVKAKQDAEKELDALIEKFVEKEKKMLLYLDDERKKSLKRPESHRDYAHEWNHFYEKKCREERVKVNLTFTVWLTYLFDSGFCNFDMKKGDHKTVFIIKRYENTLTFFT